MNNAALFLIRLASALAFLYHGSSILFGAFGGPGPVKFAEFAHLPAIIGYLVGIGQFFGGLGILLGVFTRISAAGIAVIMLGAIFLVHLPHGFDIGKGGYEYVLTQLLVALAIVLAGPRRWSLESKLPAGFKNL